jgi:hypothetical protein
MSADSNRMDGLVTNALWQQVAKQVEGHGLVVWDDPEGHYAAAWHGLTLMHGRT